MVVRDVRRERSCCVAVGGGNGTKIATQKAPSVTRATAARPRSRGSLNATRDPIHASKSARKPGKKRTSGPVQSVPPGRARVVAAAQPPPAGPLYDSS